MVKSGKVTTVGPGPCWCRMDLTMLSDVDP